MGKNLLLLLSGIIILSSRLYAQQPTSSRDYVLFGGGLNCPAQGQTTPATPGCAVQIGPSTTIVSGAVGSYSLIKTTGTATFRNLYSGGKVELANGNNITGEISVANNQNATGTILTIGSGGAITGNINVKGNTVNSGSSVNGSVTHPAGTTYSGPLPAGGNITGTPTLKLMPALPPVLTFPAAGTTNITSTRTITPGAYKDIQLNGNKTLTFRGTGDYIFRSVVNSGSVTYFVFDFQNDPNGKIRILVHGDMNVNKISITTINGGDPSRIYTETHGSGAAAPDRKSAFYMASGSGSSTPQSSAWLGTLWAPYAAITISNQNNYGRIKGAIFSGTQVNIQGGITIEHIPLALDAPSDIFPRYTPPNNFKVNDLIGPELFSLNQNPAAGTELTDLFIATPDSVWLEIIAKEGQRQTLAAVVMGPGYGLTDTISNGQNSLIITGRYPIANLLALNALPNLISFCRPVYPAINSSGIIRTAGDSAMRTNFARNGFGMTGDSVKVGVMSDSYNTLANNPAGQDVANDDLPGRPGNTVNPYPVKVLKDFPFGRRSDEGRAMLQIVHDVAPKAKLAFRTGFISPGDFALGIRELAADSCDVIVDDITYITEPFFKKGVIGDAIRDVSQQGVHYLTAAGNFSNKSYESNFTAAAAPATLTGQAHSFSAGDILQNDSLKGSISSPGVYTVVLQWVDDIYSLGGSAGTQHDFDIYLADDAGNILFGMNRNNLGGDPIEVLPFTVTANTTTNILIVKSASSPGAPTTNIRLKYVVFRGDLKINEHNVGYSTIVGQGNSPEAITVGATLYTNTPAFGINTPTVSGFSSVGGTQVEGSVSNKPDIVGPHGGNTSVDFQSIDLDGDGLPNFFGTSAAAPHVAGAVALLVEARRKFYGEHIAPAAMKSILQQTAVDMYTPGFDFTSGYGFVQADSALRSFASAKPQLIRIELEDTTLVPGVQPMDIRVIGNYLSEDTRIIFGNDTLSANVISNNEAEATIPAFFSEKSIYAYTKPVSTSGLDGGLSNAITIMGVPKKDIAIIANNKTKKYGEELPVFTSTILVNGDSLQHTSLTAADLGLENILYETQATNLSDAGIYFIRPSRTFDAANAADSLLLEKYNYGFSDGALTIQKLPLTVTVRDTTLTYGQAVAGFTFNYSIDPSYNISNTASLINSLKSSHESQVQADVIGLVNKQAVTIVNGEAIPVANRQAVTIVNGEVMAIVNGQQVRVVNPQSLTIVDGQAIPIVNELTSGQIENLNFLATTPSLAGARTINSSYWQNGVALPQTTKVVDITQEAVIDYNSNTAQTSLTSGISFVNERGLVDVESFINRQAITIVNGEAINIANRQAITIVNGEPVIIVNKQAVTIVNGQAVPIVNGENRSATIVDELDLGSGVSALKSISVVTGITPGTHTILPASLQSDNLEVSYRSGVINILPAPASVVTQDAVIFKGSPIPAFTSTVSGFMPGEEPQVNYSLSPSCAGSPGVYTIVTTLSPQPWLSNYNITITNGNLYINPKGNGAKKLRPYLECVEVVSNPANPSLRYLARFYCINDNATPLYIPVGTDNKLTSTGAFDGSSQPFIFNPGITRFTVPFSGSTLKWELKTYNSSQKTATSSTASSTSNRCSGGGRLDITQMEGMNYKELPEWTVYPNPARERIAVVTGEDGTMEFNVYDTKGRQFKANIIPTDNGKIELDISMLPAGMYYIRFKNGRSVKFIRQ